MGEDADGVPERVPLTTVIPNASVHPLDPGTIVENAFLLLKVLDEDGDAGWSFRTLAPFSREELLGALRIQVLLLERSLMQDWDVD